MPDNKDLANIENNDITESNSGIEGMEELLEENEEEGLSTKKKLFLWLFGFIAVLFSIIFLLPIDEIAHYFIAKYTIPKGIIIDFKKLDLSYFGKQKIDTLTVQTPNNISFKLEELYLDASLLDLKNGIFNGNVNATSMNLDLETYEFNLSSLKLDGKLSELFSGLHTFSGNIKISSENGGKIIKTPDFPIIGSLNDVKINLIEAGLNFRQGTINFENAIIKTSIVSLKIKGSIKILEQMNNSVLNLSLCPTLTKSFANDRPDISDTLQLYSQMSKSNCFPLKGTFAQPKLDLPNLMPSGGTTNTPQNATPNNNATNNEPPKNNPTENSPKPETNKPANENKPETDKKPENNAKPESNEQ